MINILVAPTSAGSGLTTVSLGLVRALDAQGLKVGFVKAIAPDYEEEERSVTLARDVLQLQTPDPLKLSEVQQQVSDGMLDRVLEDVVGKHAEVASDCDVMVIEGLLPDRNEPYTAKLNVEMSKALNASVLLVANAQGHSTSEIAAAVKLQMGVFGGSKASIMGCIINKAGAPHLEGNLPTSEEELNNVPSSASSAEECQSLTIRNCPVLGVIPWDPTLLSPRTMDVARALNATVLQKGELESRRVARVSLCARTIPNMLHQLQPGNLIVTPGDRADIIAATALAATNGTPLAGLLLTGNLVPDDALMEFCSSAWQSGLPLLSVDGNSFRTARILSEINTHVPADDPDRVQRIVNTVAEHLDAPALTSYIGEPRAPRLSPAAFRHQLVAKARADKRRIVLPEGEEPRTIQAAVICQTRGIADCILLGNEEKIRQVAKAQAVELPEDLTLLEPESAREQYVDAMVELRKHKNLTAPMALSQLEDNVVLGTMMLAKGEVDGLVSGAIHTTANTIRPALQLIKTKENARIVSSVFFMGLPDQVLVYGDCAVNPDPNAEELADIAIQSAESAQAMGIPVRIAMLSYSTGESGTGADVEKVREATRIVHERRPDLEIDGPLQYDAATTASVAKSKAPDSKVAGQATVLIFPDLNTGNTTYKAVQRSANVISIGPMLQGLAKPVNDLSRGALIEDIVYTIALTVIQSQQQKD
ncbi:MAG TPA: phosphate acetyltransferase [Oceanospirillales bacterium]|nr:phosphate acetyltransferase [Oceanospirillaceae bacterium]MAR01621.1 phosphate acetyltransferase [Oceanospirillaceae bacterium]HBS41235.1 phosphate acetyltransferase [Oceanospirillales bacterium]|tara:strand:- start:18942 stop:21059 length:2118 start_codon:yes stop_codon:yes gene_type:complete